MAGIPQNFQSISPVIANYDFVDIASGTGYINFYLGNTVDLKLLSNNAFYSDVITSTASLVGSTGATLKLDHDYDVLLNRPMDIQGLAIISTGVFNSNSDVTTYIVYKLRKWDGVTETEICENQSRSWTGLATYGYLTTDLNIPLTHFKKGEYLRLTLLVYGANANVSGRNITYAHDPMSRTTGWDTTGAVPSKILFQCPVRLNL